MSAHPGIAAPEARHPRSRYLADSAWWRARRFCSDTPYTTIAASTALITSMLSGTVSTGAMNAAAMGARPAAGARVWA